MHLIAAKTRIDLLRYCARFVCQYLYPFSEICLIKLYVQLNACFQQIVALLGVLVYKFYGEELREMFGYEEHPYGFYIMAGKLTPYS